MNRDPFYKQIEEALAGALDSEQFEQCAVDLLRPAYPSLVPIRGGQDEGRDGDAGMPDGSGLLLVSTIGDPGANLKKNLLSHLNKGRKERLCLLATRHILNAAARSKLEGIAQKLGYTLIRSHDGADFADRLYQSPPWCRALLHLIGTPPALSTFPITHRPLLQIDLIGRGKDLEWIRTQTGDALIIGQPGSGKTFLLMAWARENNALFVRRNEPTIVAEGIRAENPSALILDDAHLDPNFASVLRQIRADMGANFCIIANTWPGDVDVIRRNLGITSEAIRTLELLPRSEILSLIKKAGVIGPTELLREIVNQAAGRPGLAITLAQLCLLRVTLEVVLGDELAREIKTTFGKLVGDDAIPLLATFALGGRTGMRPDAVCAYLGISALELQTRVARLAAGGVIEQKGDFLRILPEPLQFALVRDVFFGEPATLAVQSLLNVVSDADSATHVLIYAKSRGAKVTSDLLIPRIEGSKGSNIWSLYASLGNEEAKWVLQRRPDLLLATADSGLREAPRSYLGALLESACEQPNHDYTRHNHPLYVVNRWICSARPGQGETMVRRNLLMEEAERWLDENHDYQVGLNALCIAFKPDFEANETDPGNADTVHLQHGLLTVTELDGLALLWPRCLNRVDHTMALSLRCLQQLISGWLTPRWIQPEAAAYKAARDHGWNMLVAFARRVPQNWSIQRWAKEYAHRFKKNDEFPLPEDVEVLFPTRDFERGGETKTRHEEALKKLVEEWALQKPQISTHRWREIVFAFANGRDRFFEQSYALAAQLAAQVSLGEILDWCYALKLESMHAYCLAPFIERVAAERPHGWIDLFVETIRNPELSQVAIYALIKHEDLPNSLDTLLREEIVKYPGVVRISCLRGEVAKSRLFFLLGHPDSRIVAEAASNLWSSEPKGEIDDSLRKAWENAVETHLTGEEHELLAICEKEKPLGIRWLRNRLKTKSLKCSYLLPGPAIVVAETLDHSLRIEFLEYLPDTFLGEEFIFALIGDDLKVFAELLNRQELRSYHSVPLHGVPTMKWAAKARVALASGWQAKDIAYSVWGGGGSWTGPMSNYWKDWEMHFTALREIAPDLIEIAEIGASYSLQQKELCLLSERRQAVFGE